MLGGGGGVSGSGSSLPPAEQLHPFQSEKLLLYDTLQGELQERIQRLEEDRQSLDISSGEAAPGAALSLPPPPLPGLLLAALPTWGACWEPASWGHCGAQTEQGTERT